MTAQSPHKYWNGENRARLWGRIYFYNSFLFAKDLLRSLLRIWLKDYG